VGALQSAGEGIEGFLTEAQVRQADAEVGFVEDANDDLLTQQRGHAGDAKVDLAPLGDDPNSPFLRQSLLGDVHLADDLDARDDGGVHPRRGFHQVAERTVDAVADAGALLVRLDVNIARTVADGGEHGNVDQAHNGAPGDHLVEVGDRPLINLLPLDNLEVGIGEGGEKGVDAHITAGVLPDELGDVGLEGQDGADPATGQGAEAVDGGQALRLGHRDGERVAHLEHGHDFQPLGLIGADKFEDLRIDQPVAQLAAGDPQALGERADERAAADDVLLDQQFAQHAVGPLLLGQGGGQLLGGDDAVLHELIAQA